MFYVDVMCMFCKSPEVTLCGWQGFNKQTNLPLPHGIKNQLSIYPHPLFLSVCFVCVCQWVCVFHLCLTWILCAWFARRGTRSALLWSHVSSPSTSTLWNTTSSSPRSVTGTRSCNEWNFHDNIFLNDRMVESCVMVLFFLTVSFE